MNTLETLRAHKDKIERLARFHGARNIRVYGPAARAEDTSDSDIDVLIDMEKSRSLLDLIGSKQNLEAMPNRPADVLTERGINPYLRERILDEAVTL